MAENSSPRSRTTEPTAREVLDELDKRVAELARRKLDVITEIVELESKGYTPIPPQSAPKARSGSDARVYLRTGEIVPKDDNNPCVKLALLYEEKGVIDDAVALANLDSFRTRVANIAELSGDIGNQWKRNLAVTAQATLSLIALRDERVRLKDEYVACTGFAIDTASSRCADEAIGPPLFSTSATAFLDACRREGIETD
jgi:hypothetical protein